MANLIWYNTLSYDCIVITIVNDGCNYDHKTLKVQATLAHQRVEHLKVASLW
jgi:hypothetical protein